MDYGDDLLNVEPEFYTIRKLYEKSHGESFLEIAQKHLRHNGLYLSSYTGTICFIEK